MEETISREEFWKEAISSRVDHILKKDSKRTEEFFNIQEEILKGLDLETRNQFETFAENLSGLSLKEEEAVYWEAFLDGLSLGILAFARMR